MPDCFITLKVLKNMLESIIIHLTVCIQFYVNSKNDSFLQFSRNQGRNLKKL